MSMDIYHQIEGLDGFAAKAREVSQVKGTSMPERIDSIAAAYKAVVDLLNMPRQENVIMAIREGDARKATEAMTELATWSGLNTGIVAPAEKVAISACMDEWGAVVMGNHNAIVHEFNRHATALGNVKKAGNIFLGNDSTELVSRLEQGGEDQFKAVVEQRTACKQLTRLARLMILNMSLGTIIPITLPAQITSPEGRSMMLAETCFDTAKLNEDDANDFAIMWRRATHDGDIHDEQWAQLANLGFIPSARKWDKLWEDSQKNKTTKQ
ncbi:hypothetical protein PG102015_0269 [Bifidobacterium pseudolongum subsp. globosum]|uniref:hypothetical protein n=1 Tax=Bifidobacterium pseudolongum TaxID=1694 RepID=UPI0010201854|nr:hypothetical protein [Bifidobacterium pseudolongum]RYP97262.1 hypothetical protein PG102015_0269 [Bifidobacterium pseudolongum subsp. globosum]